MTKFPFKQIDGIEISSKLAEIATHNFKYLKEARVNVYSINATEFPNYADYDFLYLYNPFPESIMEKVLIQIQSQVNKEKEILVIYNNPVCHNKFLYHGFYKIREYPDMWGNGIYLYTNIEKSKILE